ncbi:HNH endonuclease signature motif containing protein [Arthrobacter sp. 162MFSha1.1]|uniref:HNH endonuclease signature motif containing protein n=1 Tax=Arthrobacter sp. 162MFSha1.1 TaxID=1151119 RepID=UPI000370830B|nr:HNH endonuclease signature motif containing protein [Arthrobacter sp. 162MFSha1.1]
MGKAAVVRAFEEIRAALAVLQAEVDGAGSLPFSDIDPLAGLADGCLDILAQSREVEARVAGVKAKAAVGYAEAAHAVAGPEVPVVAQEMAVAAEIGCVLALGPRAAASFLATSHALTSSLPRTLEALQSGTLSWQHAIVLADETASLDVAGAAALEAHFLDPEAQDAARGCPAGELPAHRFRVKARTWRERHHAESMEKRHARGVAERRVEFRPDRDGMAWLGAYLPADQAMSGWNRLTAAARGLQGPAEDRTMPQLRADSFAAAILGSGDTRGGSTSLTSASASATAGVVAAAGPGAGAGGTDGAGPGHLAPVRAEVLVTVPVFALMGLTDEPGMLDGYGPVPASMARRLVADGAGSFYRVLVDPRDGAPLEIGRKSYRVPRAMRAWLRMRDGKCPFPGCSNTSLDTEADHLLAWHHGGTTGISNLGQPCPKHHRLRHTTGWKPTPASTNEPPSWTSPTGRHYTSEHQDWEPPKWPPGFLPGERSQSRQRSRARERSLPGERSLPEKHAFSPMPCEPPRR